MLNEGMIEAGWVEFSGEGMPDAARGNKVYVLLESGREVGWMRPEGVTWNTSSTCDQVAAYKVSKTVPQEPVKLGCCRVGCKNIELKGYAICQSCLDGTAERDTRVGNGTTKSDGSTASYYELPEGATQLQSLISHKDMNAQIGEIFRACYRYGEVEHSEKMRDAKKIKFYAEAEIARLEKL